MKLNTIFALATLSACLLPSLASADVAFNNFGPGDAFDTGIGWNVMGANSGFGYYETAMQFTSATTGSLGTITSGFFNVGGSQGMTVNVYADNGSNAFGTLLFSDSFTPSLSGSASLINITNLNSSIMLTAGQKYWVDYVGDVNTANAWNFDYNDTTTQMVVQFTSPNGTPINRSGDASLEVTTQAVPEPASFAALGIGLLGLISRRRRS